MPLARARRAATYLAVVGALLLAPGAPRAQSDVDDLLSIMPREVRAPSLEDRAFLALRRGELVTARELASAILAADPASIAGHTTLGVVLHEADGSLPRALFHLTRAREIFEERHGRVAFDSAAIWHSMALRESSRVAGAMGQHELKLEMLGELEELYNDRVAADRGWPLMRLRRYEEARATALEALSLDPDTNVGQHVRAYNTLCAIEGELQHRMETYLACNRSLAFDREKGTEDPVAFTNAAIGALGILRLDEAERLMLDATGLFQAGSASNPWLDLTVLYLGQARISEALEALREMVAWRQSQPPYMEEQSRAQTDVAAALFLTVAGRPRDGARLSRRALSQPDRTGYTSSETEQIESAAALVHQLACRAAAETLSEQASVAPFLESLALRWDAVKLRTSAWSFGRRAAALLAQERILMSTIRPYLPGSAEVAEWVQLELPALLGPGVVQAAVSRARERETLPEAAGYFDAFDAEIAWRKGDTAGALLAVDRALGALPQAESMLRARLLAIGGASAWSEGDKSRAVVLLSRATQIDPGMLRQLGIAVPVRFQVAGGALAERTADLLSGSPRLVRGDGLTVSVRADAHEASACLLDPQASVLGCGFLGMPDGPGLDIDARARALASEFHAQVFAPRLDLTQLDISSLDGSPTAGGGRGRERMRSVLDEILGPSAPR
jgi:tetratricopeptide (TPR) repeat protein